MAYTFSKIEDLFANGQDPGKVNIFGDGANQLPPEQAQPSGGQQPETKTSVAGDVSSGSTQSQPPQQQAQPQATPAMAQQALTKASKTQKAPSVLKNLGSQIQQSQQTLQNEANAAVETARGRNTNIEDKTLQGALSGDQASYDTVAKRLSTPFMTPDSFKSTVDPYKNKEDIENLSSFTGLKNLFKKSAGPSYTPGEAAYDATLLQRNPQFQGYRQQVVDDYNKLQQAAPEVTKSTNTQLADILGGEYGKSDADIRKRLEGLGLSEVEDAKRAMADELAARKSVDLGGVVSQSYPQAIKEAIESLNLVPRGTSESRAKEYVDDEGLISGLEQFGRVGTDLDWRDYVSSQDAESFNRALGLLGSGDIQGQGTLQAGTAPKDRGNVDLAALQKALRDAAVQKSTKIDAERQAQIDAILNPANAQAQAGRQWQEKIMQGDSELQSYLGNLGRESMREAYLKAGGSPDQADSALSYYDNAIIRNPDQFFQGVEDPRAYLNQDQLGLVQNLQRQLETNPLEAGGPAYAGEVYNPNVRFMRDDYMKAMAPLIERARLAAIQPDKGRINNPDTAAPGKELEDVLVGPAKEAPYKSGTVNPKGPFGSLPDILKKAKEVSEKNLNEAMKKTSGSAPGGVGTSPSTTPAPLQQIVDIFRDPNPVNQAKALKKVLPKW